MERLSGLDATFLYVETPTMHMQVSLLAILDPKDAPGGYDYARLHALLERLAHETPKLRQRLLQVPLAVHHPVWIEDPHFDPIHHLKRVACPAPGTKRELAELCGRINSTPLDRSRALWEIWVIEGFEDGQFALLAKIHHASLATNLEDPVERLLAIRSRSRGAKEEHNAFGGDTMANWCELASPALFSAGTRMYTRYRLANLHRPFHNVMISNVPGPPMPIYLDGAKLTAAYPMGPVMEGAGLNVTVMSYVKQVDFGFLAATALVPDVWRIADAVAPSLAELLKRAREAPLASLTV